MAGDLLNPRSPIGKKLSAMVRAGIHYAGWYPGLWISFPRGVKIHRQLASHIHFVDRSARRLARKLFHSMMIHQASLEKKQILLSRFVEIATELFAMSATCARADALHSKDAEAHAGVIELADNFCRDSRLRVKELFRAIRGNHDRSKYRFAQRVLNEDYAWLEKGAVDFPFE